MIDVNRERLLSLADAAKRIPGRMGRPISKQTVWVWTKSGRRGVKLEAVFVGGDLKTSEEAIARFSAAMGLKRGKQQKAKPKASTAEALKKEFGINLMERPDGTTDQGQAQGVPLGPVD